MWQNKVTPILFVSIYVVLHACKPPAQSFHYKEAIQTHFFYKLSGILGDANAVVDSVKIYRAVLEEKLIDRDNVGEYKLINSLSEQETVDLQVSRNVNHLFLMQLFTTPMQDDLCVFLSTTYNPSGQCTNIGPAYLGNIRIYLVDVKRTLKVKKQKGIYYLADDAKKDLSIIAYDDFPEVNDTISNIRIRQFILQENNKVGGNKPILFTTEKIFNDSNALSFTYLEMIRRSKNSSSWQLRKK